MRISFRTIGFPVAVVAVVGVGFLATRGTGGVPTSLRAQVLKHETLIAQCMHSHGFDYIVSVPKDVVAQEAAQRASQQGRDTAAAILDAQRRAPDNPNDALVAKLSAQRQQDWGDALWGTADSTGCYYSTYEAAWGVNLDAVVASGAEHVARVKADPSVRQAERDYIACMAQRGYRVMATDDVFAQVAQRRESMDVAAGEALERAAEAAHNACVAPYQKAYDSVYLRLRTN